MMGGDMGMGGMWGMGLGMLIWTALLIALIAVAVVLVVKAVRRPDQPAHRGSSGRREDWSAEDEVRMRYARGELDTDEFRRRLQDLREN